MIITSVQLNKLDEIKPGTIVDGLPMNTHPEIIYFDVDVEGEEANVVVPNDPSNRHYWDVKDWYDAQEVKPFNFAFEELAEPVFEETIYPPEPEETDETEAEAEQLELPVVAEEPETLLPR